MTECRPFFAASLEDNEEAQGDAVRPQQQKPAHAASPSMWRSIDTELPNGEVLIYSAGRRVVAVLVPSEPPAFIDARVADILPWPTHWMPIPDLPEQP